MLLSEVVSLSPLLHELDIGGCPPVIIPDTEDIVCYYQQVLTRVREKFFRCVGSDCKT